MRRSRIAAGAAALAVAGGVGYAAHTHTTTIRTVGQPPGATNPAVTQATLGSTICVPGWASSVRPPTSFTGPLKQKLYNQLHLTGGLAAWELDHYTAISDGGSPTSLDNLWMVPITQARVDDKVEVAVNHKICSGQESLVQGQAELTAWKRAHG